MTTKPDRTPRNTAQRFNDTTTLSELISLFSLESHSIESTIQAVNKNCAPALLNMLRFSLLKLTPEYLVYVNDKGKAAVSHTDTDSLRAISEEIKRDRSGVQPADTLTLKGAILIAAKGAIKSYDVFADLGSLTAVGQGPKKAIIESSVWSSERRQLHDKIVDHALEEARSLSAFIQSSNVLESGLYCMRGTVASGKSTFIKTFLGKDKAFVPALMRGVINTDQIRRELIKHTDNPLGAELPAYAFHDEASMLSKRLFARAKSENLLYIVDKRMQEAGDLGEILDDAEKRSLPLTVFDVRVDFVTSTLRVLRREGIYPSDPTPDFSGLFKSYKNIEKGRHKFLSEAIHSQFVKNLYAVTSSDTAQGPSILLKHNYAATDQGKLSILVDSVDDVDEKSMANSMLPYGSTLKDALDDHSQSAFMSERRRISYKNHLLKNIELTSRTLHGDLNTTASPDKHAKLVHGMSQDEVAFYSRRNLNWAFDFIYTNRYLPISDVAVLRNFIDQVSKIVNKDIITDESLLIRQGANSHKYNYVDTRHVEVFYDEFVNRLYHKLMHVDSSTIETAAWIEWNIDFTGHIFSDGCGRIAKLISTWSLMRRNGSLPEYTLGQGEYESVRASYRKRFAVRENIPYIEPTRDKNYEEFLGYYAGLFFGGHRDRSSAAGGLVYNSAGQFLILQATSATDHGKWIIPGTKMQYGEHAEDAFKREVMNKVAMEIRDIVPLGTREYVSQRGNHYHFFDFSSRAIEKSPEPNPAPVVDYAWINRDQIKDYTFSESVKSFLETYFANSGVDYYKHTEEISLTDLDVPNFHEHTMATSLTDYVNSKLPAALADYLPYIRRFEVHGIYPDLNIISKLDLNFHIIEVIAGSTAKKYSSNDVRPVFLLVERDLEKFIVCCTTPGTDLILHYASMVAHLIRKHPHITLSVAHYPLAERQIDIWTNLDSQVVHKGDVVLLGYGTFLKQQLDADIMFRRISTYSNKFYTSTRFLCTKNNQIVNCLEANYSYWGNLSNYMSNKICRLGAQEIIHAGKVGTLRSPKDVYTRVYLPSDFAVGRRHHAIQPVPHVNNSLAYNKEYLSSTHISVSTTMEETFAQRDLLEKFGVDTIDIESSKIAQGISLYNHTAGEKVRFGSIHFASDYLRKREDLNSIPEVDLSTARSVATQSMKRKILTDMYGVISRHISRQQIRTTKGYASVAQHKPENV